jgi:hypothetical protein
VQATIIKVKKPKISPTFRDIELEGEGIQGELIFGAT